MKLYQELNEKLPEFNFEEFNTNFAIVNNEEFINENIRIYIAKFENGTYKVFDGGNTIGVCSEKYNLSSKEFIDKFVEIIDKNKISKQDMVLYSDCEEKDLKITILNLYNTTKQIFSI